MIRWIKKISKWLGIFLLSLILIANLIIIFSGRLYIYKGIRYTYLRGHVRPHIYDLDVFQNRTVEAGIAQPWQTHPAVGNKLTLSPGERLRIESLEPASFLVAWGDTIIYEEYWNGHDQERVSNSFSMAKSVVSLLIGVAVEEGHIKSIDEPVANYLPEFNDEKKDITIRDVLTMSTGLSWSESYIHPFCDVAELYYDSDDRNLALNRRTIEEEPGKIWRYKSGDTQVLAYILKEATGKSISEYASEKLWQPMGAESDAFWSLADGDESTEKAFCCFYSTSRDFIRLGKLVNHRGNWNGKQLVPADYVDEFSSLAPLKMANGQPNNCYGFQYWIYTGMPYKVSYFRGISGQYIISIPEKDLVIVRTGNGTENKWENYGNVKDDALINHRTDLPFYIKTGVRLLEEVKKL